MVCLLFWKFQVRISLFLWTNYALQFFQHETLFADIEFMQKRVLIISFDAISFCLIYLLHTHTYIYIVSKENISKFYDIETKYIFSIIMDLSVLTVKHILLRLINCFLFKDQWRMTIGYTKIEKVIYFPFLLWSQPTKRTKNEGCNVASIPQLTPGSINSKQMQKYNI